jgi:hypothetical protein
MLAESGQPPSAAPLLALPTVASALIRFPDLPAQLVFTPLLAGWSIWIGWRFVSATFDRERLITGTR